MIVPGAARRYAGAWHFASGVSPTPRKGASGAQVAQNSQDAAVILGRGRQLQLPEDARHVLLHGALGDHHLLGDRVVGAALGHQLEHLALARAELVERVLTAAT